MHFAATAGEAAATTAAARDATAASAGAAPNSAATVAAAATTTATMFRSLSQRDASADERSRRGYRQNPEPHDASP
jgi:hypothetical protein